MPYIPCENCVRVSLQQRLAGQVVVNTISLLKAGSVVSADLPLVCSAAQGWWENYIAPNVATGFTLEYVNAIDLTTASSPSYSLAITPPSAGEISVGSGLPNNAAAVISWRTDLRGRSFRGRMYLAGLLDTSLASSTRISSTTQTALAIAAVNLSSFFDSLDFAHVIISRFSGGVARDEGFPATVTSAVIDIFVDSMRRRLENRGA